MDADQAVWSRARRPKLTKVARLAGLAGLAGLAAMVEEKLEHKWSPRQIGGWLRRRFPSSTVMRVPTRPSTAPYSSRLVATFATS